MIIVLSCKEAMYKAWGASGEFHQLSLTMQHCGARWRAVKAGSGPEVVASWEVVNGSILTFAIAGPTGWSWRLLDRILGSAGRQVPNAQDHSPSELEARRTAGILRLPT
jgi:hypothetical protein